MRSCSSPDRSWRKFRQYRRPPRLWHYRRAHGQAEDHASGGVRSCSASPEEGERYNPPGASRAIGRYRTSTLPPPTSQAEQWHLHQGQGLTGHLEIVTRIGKGAVAIVPLKLYSRNRFHDIYDPYITL